MQLIYHPKCVFFEQLVPFKSILHILCDGQLPALLNIIPNLYFSTIILLFVLQTTYWIGLDSWPFIFYPESVFHIAWPFKSILLILWDRKLASLPTIIRFFVSYQNVIIHSSNFILTEFRQLTLTSNPQSAFRIVVPFENGYLPIFSRRAAEISMNDLLFLVSTRILLLSPQPTHLLAYDSWSLIFLS